MSGHHPRIFRTGGDLDAGKCQLGRSKLQLMDRLVANGDHCRGRLRLEFYHCDLERSDR